MTNYMEKDLASAKHMAALVGDGDTLKNILDILETQEKFQQIKMDCLMERVRDLQEVRERIDRIEQRNAAFAKLDVLLKKDAYNNLDHIDQVCLHYKTVCYQSLTPPNFELAETKITRLTMLNRRFDVGSITDDEVVERSELATALGFDSK